MPKLAVVMISIGHRPWAHFTRRTFTAYCAENGFTFAFVDSEDALSGLDLPCLSSDTGRQNKKVYAAKTFLAWRFMKEYGFDRVAVVDDSCSVSVRCPALFDVVPRGLLGGTGTSERSAKETFERLHGLMGCDVGADVDPKDYLKGGLLVYSKEMIPIIAPERIRESAVLLNSPQPHQTQTYYLFKSRGVGFFKMPPEFLRLPITASPGMDRRSMRRLPRTEEGRAYIWAVSSVYRYRYWLAARIAVDELFAWSCRRKGVPFAVLERAGLTTLLWVRGSLLVLESLRLRALRKVRRLMGRPDRSG